MATKIHITPRGYMRIFRVLCVLQGRLRPGRMLLVDTGKKIFVRDEELKLEIARLRPVRKWLRTQVIHLDHLHRDFQVRDSLSCTKPKTVFYLKSVIVEVSCFICR